MKNNFMSYQIRHQNGQISVVLKENKKFNIQLDQFKVTRNHTGIENCCDLFIHLKTTKKKWIDDDLFYELALIINSEIPDHDINWVNTFIAIEQENYSTHLVNESDETDGVDVFENIELVFESSEIQNDEFSKPEVRNGLREQVEEKLKMKRIITR